MARQVPVERHGGSSFSHVDRASWTGGDGGGLVVMVVDIRIIVIRHCLAGSSVRHRGWRHWDASVCGFGQVRLGWPVCLVVSLRLSRV